MFGYEPVCYRTHWRTFARVVIVLLKIGPLAVLGIVLPEPGEILDHGDELLHLVVLLLLLLLLLYIYTIAARKLPHHKTDNRTC